MKTTVSRRAMMAGIPAAALLPAATQANVSQGKHLTTTHDPVLAAIEKHRRATQALSAAHEPSDALLHELSRAEDDALLAWLTTPSTTLTGVIAHRLAAGERAAHPGRGLCGRPLIHDCGCRTPRDAIH